MNVIEQIRAKRDMLDQHHMYERLIGDMSDRIEVLEAEAQRAQAGWVKEIECHRNTTLKLIKLQEKQR
jgi:hypothetical protein